MDTEGGAAVPGADAGRLFDERRLWERVAFGRGSTDAERQAALAALGGPPDPPAAQDPQPSALTARPSGAAPAPPLIQPPRRWRRAVLLAVVIVGSIVVAGELPRGAAGSDSILVRARVTGDGAVPSWLAGAIEQAARGPGSDTEEELLSTVRLIEDDRYGAHVFRDQGATTVCIAADKAVHCVGSDEFAERGLVLEALEPIAGPLSAAVRYGWGRWGDWTRSRSRWTRTSRCASSPHRSGRR
ncbi:MAG: hypothetical protein JWP66_618 [Naasia sp.]|nr:hypothetical protein [Naasia sp.]